MPQIALPPNRSYLPIVKRRLMRGETIDTRSFVAETGHWRLGAAIHYLRRKDWPIESYRDQTGVAHYYIPSGQVPPGE